MDTLSAIPFDLPHIWAALIAFAVLAYIALDGFDLGIGLLFPFFVRREDRDVMMNSVAPVWDGNETWLVLGGGGLMAAFPLAYAVLAPAVYAPIIAMLIGLVFRGVAFEFRFKAESARARGFWSAGFWVGSLLAAMAQGAIVGAVVQGVEVENRAFAGDAFDWLTPFTVFTALALPAGYALLGAGWLLIKTEGTLQLKVWIALPWAAGLTYLGLGGLSLWMLADFPGAFERWLTWPQALYSGVVPVLSALIALGLLWAYVKKAERAPLPLALGLFLLAFIGLGVNLYPNILPPSVSIAEAAADPAALSFLLVGALILIPIILAYTAYAYWVFRGKTGDEGYH